MKPFREAVREITSDFHQRYEQEEMIDALLTAFEELVPEARSFKMHYTNNKQEVAEQSENFGWNACRAEILKRLREAR